MFRQPQSRQNFYELEKDILTWWKENDILEKSINQRPEDKMYTFYDGPITANGEPHYGHMMTFSVKDLIPRYWTMKGYRVSRSLGWDCHGIPVEWEVEKNLGFKEKSDIEKYGIEKFNKKCRAAVQKYQSNIIELEEMMGRITNDEEEYATMDADFIESVWWSLKTLFEKDLLYEGFKVVPYSTRAGTVLSNAEVALGGYKEIVDPAITVKFELEDEPGTHVLAWTTTPWTMPSNLGLAVGKKIKYVKVKKNDSEELYIIAKDLIESIFGEDDSSYKVVEEIGAADLVGKKYKPPFDFFTGKKNAHQIYEGFHVNTESGTGIVHLAPYGAEDNEIFQEVGIESFDVLNDQGDFTKEVPAYSGMFYKKANKQIIKDLESNGTLFKHEDYPHDMPMCWRTDTPLIYKPITSWFVRTADLREKLVENNNKINWYPNHVKDGRFGNWLAEIKDWGISRNRYWGTPLPVWKSESGKVKFIGSFEELQELSGMELKDPHRPYVDDVTFEIDGETYTRITDVIDVWYDSGSMPFARLHYPFENKDAFEQKFPAQFIGESVDQTRGWFYSLHAIATAVFDGIAFENVVMNGFTLDDNGVKQSKSKKNYTDPVPTIEKFGGDAVRINFFSTPIVLGEDTTISETTLKQTTGEVMLPLWNIYKYFVTYANMHNWMPTEEMVYNERSVTSDSHPWDHIPFDDVENNLDAWMLLLLQNSIKTVNESLGAYHIPNAMRAVKNLISETSKWYIRSNRDRFADGDEMVMATLYYTLIETIKLLAPFAPFISEYMYRTLVFEHFETTAKESIHLTDYPEADKSFIAQYENIESEMEILRKIVEMGHTLRTENALKVRQPLGELKVELRNNDLPSLSNWMQDLLMNELNVKTVENGIQLKQEEGFAMIKDDRLNIVVSLGTEITPELKTEGMLRELTRNIQALRKKAGMNMGDSVKIALSGSESVLDAVKQNLDSVKETVTASEISFEENSGKEVKVNGEVVRIEIKK